MYGTFACVRIGVSEIMRVFGRQISSNGAEVIFMIFDVLLILFVTLISSACSFAAGKICMREKKDEKKKSDGWEGILNYDHKRGGDGA